MRAKGNMPYLKNLDKEFIERFRTQITPVNIVGEYSSKKIDEIIDKLLATKPEEFSAQAIEIKKMAAIKAQTLPKWVPDPQGFFVISVDRNRKKIIVEHFHDDKLENKIVGEKAEDICKTVANLGLIGDFE